MQRAYSIFCKQTQNRFWIHKFPQETDPEKHRNQCLQYIGTVTVRLSEAKRRVKAKYIFKVIQFNG